MKWPLPLGAVITLVGLAPAPAQEADDSELALLDTEAEAVSSSELETFADIFVDIEKIASEYEMALAAVESEEEARELQARQQRETRDAIARHGWTEQQYEAVNETINASPELLERALALIDDADDER